MRKTKTYKFNGKIWKYKGKSGWYFITLPISISKTIRKNHGQSEEGWGRLKADAKMKSVAWRTAIWFDTKHKSYLLPVKSAVRKAENLSVGDIVKVTLKLELSLELVF